MFIFEYDGKTFIFINYNRHNDGVYSERPYEVFL